jgi:hypothetical protein
VSLALARVCSAAAPSLLTHPLFDYVSPQPLFFNHRIAYANLEMMITLPTSSSCYAFCRLDAVRFEVDIHHLRGYITCICLSPELA